MKKFTIFGNPVSHSKSPLMHNAGFQALGFDAQYTRTHLLDGDDIKNTFMAGGFSGANITVPHKEFAFKHADILDPLAKQIGAVNTFVLQSDGKIKGYNTDALGFYESIKELKYIKSILIFGAGGTSKSLAVVLKSKNFAVTILNRSSNGEDFFTSIGCLFYTWDNFESNQKFELIINSTSAGLSDNLLPAPQNILENLLTNSPYCIDCIYGKVTPFLELAKLNGCATKDGEDMLLYQGVLAFELFTNTKVDEKIIATMREALKKTSQN